MGRLQIKVRYLFLILLSITVQKIEANPLNQAEAIFNRIENSLGTIECDGAIRGLVSKLLLPNNEQINGSIFVTAAHNLLNKKTDKQFEKCSIRMKNSRFNRIDIDKISETKYQSKDNALEALEKGTLSALVTLNSDSEIIVTTREGDLAEKEVVENFVFKIINQDADPVSYVTSEIADMNYQGYKGFIVPGIAAMAIMQNGIFSVVFTLLSYKNQGVLKRLKAAPISPSHFIVGHLISRVSIIILQTFILLLILENFFTISPDFSGHPSSIAIIS